MNNWQFTIENLQLLTPEQAWRYRVIPKIQTAQKICFLVDEAMLTDALLEELELIFGREVETEQASSDTIQKLLATHYLREEQGKSEIKLSGVQSDDFLFSLVSEARRLQSSDIHFEIYEERCRIRIRIDGQMVERYVFNKNEYPSIVNRIKIMANMDIAEKRLPQDGRIFFSDHHHKFDIRVSVLPTLYGEKVVLRLLNNDATHIHIENLGISEFDLTNYLDGIQRPNGIVLISGPTGSGKTTTLYATLKLLNKKTRNILTIEDPIEYTLEGINQVQLKENIGFDFSSALRTFLRQDPDIIMVGEIRDKETANMAIRAALTGHLVLSTIHTNSAWATILRLIDMGIPSFLLANTLNTTVAQRLVRILCPLCKKKTPFNESAYPKQFQPFRKLNDQYIPTGCEKCFYTGYKGRVAVYEVILIDAELAELIKTGVSDISAELKHRQIKTLAENAFGLFETGQTSLEEIYPLLINF